MGGWVGGMGSEHTAPSSGMQPFLQGFDVSFMNEPHSPRMTGNLMFLPVVVSVYPYAMEEGARCGTFNECD